MTDSAKTEEYVLRTFVCKHCGHEVVVNPKLPRDAQPECCAPCWEKVVKPRLDRKGIELMSSLTRFLSALNDQDLDRGTKELNALLEEMQPKSGDNK